MSNKKFGYARVSTTEQNEDRQVLDLMEYGIDERDIYVDKQSGRSFERMNYLALARSADGLIQMGRKMNRAGIGVYTPAGKVQLAPPSAFFYSKCNTEEGTVIGS